jgi:heterodisulfide reductase subunit D
MSELLSKKQHYLDTTITVGQPLSEELQKECYATFSCRHKFCREVCPVYREERNESHTSYGFQTTLLAVSEGLENLEDILEDFTYCLECGGCELRCPTTLFAADFYRYETTTVDLVRKVRRDLVSGGHTYEGFAEVKKYIDSHMNLYNGPEEELTKWAKGLNVTLAG